MANSKDKNNNGPQSPDTVVCEFLNGVKNDINAAESAEKSSEIIVKAKITNKSYKICCLDKAEETNDYYQDIVTGIAIKNNTKAGIVKQQVDDYIKKDKEIETKIKEVSVLLNDLKTKMEDANNEACIMSNCVKNKLFPKSGKSTKNNSILDSLDKILEKTKTLNEKTQNAFESIVILAGIQTFTNTESLKDHAQELFDKMKNFKVSVDSNVTSTWEEVKTFKDELNKVMEELGQVECDWQIKINLHEAIIRLREFMCEYECDEECIDLCKEKDKCLDNDNDDYNKDYPKRNRQSRDQN